ncbi:hypothetical protein L198_02919 [Cryptococcus wingfieldii CBS 7118]|uniref:Uncharacterized protein n=1 Tax=Cryptococcus wingfieldii CBS 7118 TaxID=1295528 RepID=A0A1E3JI80_9TREE|nr:hypothetical protein L198_02919 [Cryptococcus wingfieldii CBS 7118]ODO00599.1 hypothetical protein L198_02919 [Cryptococcus wingfieldii CBS 7118]
MSNHRTGTWSQTAGTPYDFILEGTNQDFDEVTALVDSDDLFTRTAPVDKETTSYVFTAYTHDAGAGTLRREAVTAVRQPPPGEREMYDVASEASTQLDKAITCNLYGDTTHNSALINSCFSDHSVEGLKEEERTIYSKLMAKDEGQYKGVQLLQLDAGTMRDLMVVLNDRTTER